MSLQEKYYEMYEVIAKYNLDYVNTLDTIKNNDRLNSQSEMGLKVEMEIINTHIVRESAKNKDFFDSGFINANKGMSYSIDEFTIESITSESKEERINKVYRYLIQVYDANDECEYAEAVLRKVVHYIDFTKR